MVFTAFLVYLIPALCLAKHAQPSQPVASPNELELLVQKEAKALFSADSALTVADCVSKCDAMFELVDPADEMTTDAACDVACKCAIDQICPAAAVQPTDQTVVHGHGHAHPTHATHATHRPHPTHSHP